MRLSALFVCLCCICLFGCAKNKSIDKATIRQIKPPKWVRDAGVGDGFSAIGITNREVVLSKAFEYAKENAVENLMSNILVKLENLFIEECGIISQADKKAKILNMLNQQAREAVSFKYLNRVIRADEMWHSPESHSLYLKVVADKKLVATAVSNSIDKIKDKYKNDQEVITLIGWIKKDIVYNNYRIDKSRIVNHENDIVEIAKSKVSEKVVDGKNGIGRNDINVINYVVTNSNGGDDDFSSQDDEIDKQIREAIKMSEEG